MGLCILGSSLVFSAQGGRGKEKNLKPAEKIAVGSEGAAEFPPHPPSAAPSLRLTAKFMPALAGAPQNLKPSIR